MEWTWKAWKADMVDLFLLRRMYNNSYYTVRNNKNALSVVAFPCKHQATRFLKMVKNVEHHKQPLVIEEVPYEFILDKCQHAALSVSVFEYMRTDDYEVPAVKTTTLTASSDVDIEASKFYFENKYKYCI